MFQSIPRRRNGEEARIPPRDEGPTKVEPIKMMREEELRYEHSARLRRQGKEVPLAAKRALLWDGKVPEELKKAMKTLGRF